MIGWIGRLIGLRAIAGLKIAKNLFGKSTVNAGVAGTAFGATSGLVNQGTKSFKQLAILFIVLHILANRK